MTTLDFHTAGVLGRRRNFIVFDIVGNSLLRFIDTNDLDYFDTFAVELIIIIIIMTEIQK